MEIPGQTCLVVAARINIRSWLMVWKVVLLWLRGVHVLVHFEVFQRSRIQNWQRSRSSLEHGGYSDVKWKPCVCCRRRHAWWRCIVFSGWGCGNCEAGCVTGWKCVFSVDIPSYDDLVVFNYILVKSTFIYLELRPVFIRAGSERYRRWKIWCDRVWCAENARCPLWRPNRPCANSNFCMPLLWDWI